jgi:hypothetical protein
MVSKRKVRQPGDQRIKRDRQNPKVFPHISVQENNPISTHLKR